MTNFRFTVCYDGTRYSGWEHQTHTEDTIQGKIETVLSRMCGDVPVKVVGVGRTDAGVHAKAMTANALLDTSMTADAIRDYMNRYLPEDICILDVKEASQRFHSRYNASGKTYCYTCWIGKTKPVFDRKYVTVLDSCPNIPAMRLASLKLTGTHDFASFCGNPKMRKGTVRTVDRIQISLEGDYLKFNYHGDGFLQHMVRIMTGTLLEVGFGKMSPNDMDMILTARDRSKAGPTIPPQGLCLMEVDYN